MTPKGIVEAVKTLLENDSTLSGYVKKYFHGFRDYESQTLFPSICVDSVLNTERDSTYNLFENTLTVLIIGAVKNDDPDKLIIGDANNKGAYDLEQDIKKAIDSDPTLSGAASQIFIRTTEHVLGLNPVRQITMTLEVEYRQNQGTRT